LTILDRPPIIAYVRSEKGIRMSIQRTLIETKYKLNLMTERYTKYILWQTDHYQYEVDMIATFNYRKFTKTVNLNQMAYEEAIKVFKEESTEDAFRAARTTRDYLDERPIRNDVDAFAMMYKR
tara:strand:- start:343 stop:711 length:369 start_codon:yes stop_codon:yes gene_type:complete